MSMAAASNGSDVGRSVRECWVVGANDSLLLDPAWRKLVAELDKVVVKCASTTIHEVPHARQIVYALLGPSCVRRHFPTPADQPLLLEPPYMDKETREALFQELETKLINACGSEIRARGIFESDVWSNFKTALDECYHDYSNERTQAGRPVGASEALAYGLGRTVHSHQWRLRSQPDSAQATLTALQGRGREGMRPDDGDALARQALPKGAVASFASSGSAGIGGGGDLDEFGTQFRERVLNEVPERRSEFTVLFRKMKGRSLPKPLRRFLWRWMLSTDEQVEMVAQQLARACATQRVEDPTHTHLADLIEATTLSRVEEVMAIQNSDSGAGAGAGQIERAGEGRGAGAMDGPGGGGGGTKTKTEAGSGGDGEQVGTATDSEGGDAAPQAAVAPELPKPDSAAVASGEGGLVESGTKHTQAVQLALNTINMFYVLTGQQRESHVSVAVVLTHVLCDHNHGPGDTVANLTDDHVFCMFLGLVSRHIPGSQTLNQELALPSSLLLEDYLTPDDLSLKIWTIVSERDSELYHHIARLSALNQGVSRWTVQTDVGPQALIPLLRHWCEVALAGVVRPDALLFVWDQCILFGWDLLAKFGSEVILMAKDATAEATDVASFMAALEAKAKMLHTRAIRGSMANFGGPSP